MRLKDVTTNFYPGKPPGLHMPRLYSFTGRRSVTCPETGSREYACVRLTRYIRLRVTPFDSTSDAIINLPVRLRNPGSMKGDPHLYHPLLRYWYLVGNLSIQPDIAASLGPV